MSEDPQVRIMGLDLSLNGTGVCLADGSTFRIPGKAKDGDARLTRIRDHVRLAARTDHTWVAAIEGMGGRYPGNQAATLGEVHGAVKSELMDQAVPYAVVPQKTLKLFATGNGNADKAAMAAAALAHAGLSFESDDECDAWWLWRAAVDWYLDGRGFERLPDSQRDALGVITWPPLPESRVWIKVDGCGACYGKDRVHHH